MDLYFLDYDLKQKQEHDYQKLYDELAKFNAVRILESLWCFKRTNTTAEQLRDYFGRFTAKNDSLCVSKIADWATVGTLGNPNQLL